MSDCLKKQSSQEIPARAGLTRGTRVLRIRAGIAMPILPCNHDPRAVAQIQPTIDLLNHLDVNHPDVLERHGITPADYHAKKVFRSAVESIRGTFIASTQTQRLGLVETFLERLRLQERIAEFESRATQRRFDFTVVFSREPRVAAALEVKGGEGNSIDISERPLWAQEFYLWCHLDGAIRNEPSHAIQAIIATRLAGALVRDPRKVVDAVFVRDSLCGTPLRPCPKYPPRVAQEAIAPDIFLFPRHAPTEDDPNPPAHDLASLRLPRMILESVGVPPAEQARHVWEVRIEVATRARPKGGGTRRIRRTTVRHQGEVVFAGEGNA